MFSIARYKWFQYLRKIKDDISFDDLADNYLKESADIETLIVNKAIAEKIIALLNKETHRVKNIVLMRIDGYSFYEISQKYNISESSARVIDFRAKKKIKEILEKEVKE